MITHPQIGQRVRLRYRRQLRRLAPYHDAQGVVIVRARGPGPKNHGVRIGADLVCVPCGHLMRTDQPPGSE